jgi:hypothetical protein
MHEDRVGPTALEDGEMLRLCTMINGKDPRAQGFGWHCGPGH